MNRAIPLLIATAAMGGGLAFFALKSDPGGPAQRETGDPIALSEDSAPEEPAVPKASASSATLVDPNDAPRASFAAPGGRAKAWEVLPMNSVGQRIDSAKIEAIPSAEVGAGIPPLTGEGRTKWLDVPSGLWTLTVTAEDAPTWTREIEIPAKKTTRTPIAMGPEIRVTGEVRDTNGAPLPRNTPVFILAKNAVHPSLSQRRLKTQAGRIELPEGVVAAQTDARGRFQVALPEAGEYRLSVGDMGSKEEARWTQKKGFELTYGGPDHIVGTVPARPELTVRFTGSADERPSAIAAYIYDAERAAQMERGASAQGFEASEMTLLEAQKAAKLEAMGYAGKEGKEGSLAAKGGARAPGKYPRGGTGTARPMSEENRRMQESDFESGSRLGSEIERSPLFEPGWRSIGSRTVDANGEAVFNNVPPREDVRFLFIRGSERVTTVAPIRMRSKQRGIGEATLPPPAPEGTPTRSNLGTMKVKDRPEDPEAPTLSPGVVWSIRKR